MVLNLIYFNYGLNLSNIDKSISDLKLKLTTSSFCLISLIRRKLFDDIVLWKLASKQSMNSYFF